MHSLWPDGRALLGGTGARQSCYMILSPDGPASDRHACVSDWALVMCSIHRRTFPQLAVSATLSNSRVARPGRLQILLLMTDQLQGYCLIADLKSAVRMPKLDRTSGGWRMDWPHLLKWS